LLKRRKGTYGINLLGRAEFIEISSSFDLCIVWAVRQSKKITVSTPCFFGCLNFLDYRFHLGRTVQFNILLTSKYKAESYNRELQHEFKQLFLFECYFKVTSTLLGRFLPILE